MKRVIFLALSIMVMSFAFGSANSWEKIELITVVSPDGGEQTEMNATDLPKAVRDVLASSDYRGWRAEEKVHLVKKADGNEFYKITLKNSAGETKTIKMDKDGNEIKK
ncbi:MAG: hypothetical protein ACNA7V_12330 [Bacteroidales bacterium]